MCYILIQLKSLNVKNDSERRRSILLNAFYDIFV